VTALRDPRTAVVVCSHVAAGAFPAKWARRDAPSFPEDSGWQFTCLSSDRPEADGKLWALEEAARIDGIEALDRPLSDYPVGTVLHRPTGTGPWQVYLPGGTAP
jgi:hypothetical protein